MKKGKEIGIGVMEESNMDEIGTIKRMGSD